MKIAQSHILRELQAHGQRLRFSLASSLSTDPSWIIGNFEPMLENKCAGDEGHAVVGPSHKLAEASWKGGGRDSSGGPPPHAPKPSCGVRSGATNTIS